MILENIEIKAYKGIRDFKLKPQKLNVITGKIGSGKSSILEAVRYAVTGVAETPQKAAEVAVWLFGGKEIRRRISEKSKGVRVEGRASSQESVKKIIESNTGLSMESMKVITSGKLLSDMKAGTLSEFLVTSGLIPMIMEFKRMVDLCEIPPILAKSLTEYLPQTKPFGLDEIQEAYRKIYDERTALNHEISLVTAQAAFEGDKPARSIAQIESELSEMVGYEEKLRAYKILEENYERAKSNQKRIQNELQEIESRIKATRIPKPDEAVKTRLLTEEETLRKELADVSQIFLTLSRSVAVEKKALDNLSNPTCPLSNKLTCKTDKMPIRIDIEASIAEMSAELDKAQNKTAQIEAQIRKNKSDLTEINKKISQYEELCRLHETRKTLLASIPPLPERPARPADTPDRARRKAELQTEKNRLEAYSRSLTARRHLTDLKRRLGVLEQMLKTLSPKSGLREKIIMSILTPLEEHCNNLAEKLRLDFKMSIRMQNGVAILCKPKASVDFVELKSLSSGEQALAVFLILDMLNTLSGFGMLMMDNLDALDADALDELLAVLTMQDVLDRYDHIFISMVSHDDSCKVLNKYKGSINEMIRLS